VDCRTDEEKDPNNENFIPKSRYSTINHYISNHNYVKPEYYDTIQYKVDPSLMETLLQTEGIDEKLAFHVASLFSRDPIPAYSSEFDEEQINDSQNLSHFENL
jgi:glutamate--cysteine ligase catalytic subunit